LAVAACAFERQPEVLLVIDGRLMAAGTQQIDQLGCGRRVPIGGPLLRVGGVRGLEQSLDQHCPRIRFCFARRGVRFDLAIDEQVGDHTVPPPAPHELARTGPIAVDGQRLTPVQAERS
jgi:hypothetical protein